MRQARWKSGAPDKIEGVIKVIGPRFITSLCKGHQDQFNLCEGQCMIFRPYPFQGVQSKRSRLPTTVVFLFVIRARKQKADWLFFCFFFRSKECSIPIIQMQTKRIKTDISEEYTYICKSRSRFFFLFDFAFISLSHFLNSSLSNLPSLFHLICFSSYFFQYASLSLCIIFSFSFYFFLNYIFFFFLFFSRFYSLLASSLRF